MATNLLAECTSVRAKCRFLLFTDWQDHHWAEHAGRDAVDLRRGKWQLAGGRLDARYQMIMPAGLTGKAGAATQ